jgi:hypothetical protein
VLAAALPTRLAWALAALALALLLSGSWLLWLNRATPGVPETYGYRWAQILLVLVSGLVGLLLATRVPRNPVGSLFIALSLNAAVLVCLEAYAAHAIVTRAGALPGGYAAAWTYNWIWIPLMLTAGVLLPLIFPDGRVLTAAWKRVAWLAAAAAVLAVAGEALASGPLDAFPVVDNPLDAGPLSPVATAVGLTLLLLCVAASVASQFVRYRRASDDERHQIKWVAFAAALVAVSFVLAGLAEGPLHAVRKPFQTAMLLSLALMPIATGVAVLRYRLYEIDFLINRTFVYVPLTALLAGMYVALSGLLGALLREVTAQGAESSVVAVSTLAVVALLTPLKNLLQAIVDRRFKDPPAPDRELNRIRDQARSYVEVADAGRFLARYIEQLVLAFNARGGAFAFHDVRRTVAAGEWPLTPALEAQLMHEDRALGSLTLGPRRDSRAYTAGERTALEDHARVAASVVALHDAVAAPSAER